MRVKLSQTKKEEGGIYGEKWDDSLSEDLANNDILEVKNKQQFVDNFIEENTAYLKQAFESSGMDFDFKKISHSRSETMKSLASALKLVHKNPSDFDPDLKKMLTFIMTFVNEEEDDPIEYESGFTPPVLDEDFKEEGRKVLEEYHLHRQGLVAAINSARPNSEAKTWAEQALEDFEAENESIRDDAEVKAKFDFNQEDDEIESQYQQRNRNIQLRLMRRHMERLMEETKGKAERSRDFPRLFAFYLSTFKPKDRSDFLETMGVDPKRPYLVIKDKEWRKKICQISRAMLREGDVIGKNVHEDLVQRLSISEQDPFAREEDELALKEEDERVDRLAGTLSNLSRNQQIAVLDDIITQKNLNRLNGQSGRKALEALRSLPEAERTRLQDKVAFFVDQELREDLLEMALLQNLRFDSLDAASKAELRLVTYLKRLQTERRLDEGDVRMELSRRRLGLDPSIFRGVRPDPHQDNRVRMVKHLEVAHYSRDLTPLEREYVELFPGDGLGGLSLASNFKYMTLVEMYNLEKAHKGAPFFEMDIAIWDLADMYFEMFGNSEHALQTDGQLEQFRNDLMRREAKIFIDQDIQLKNLSQTSESFPGLLSSLPKSSPQPLEPGNPLRVQGPSTVTMPARAEAVSRFCYPDQTLLGTDLQPH